MSVPDYETLMLPVLQTLQGGKEIKIAEIRQRVARELNLSDSDLQEKVPSGVQTLFVNRVSWAAVYMTKAGLMERVQRGTYRLTSEGIKVLRSSFAFGTTDLRRGRPTIAGVGSSEPDERRITGYHPRGFLLEAMNSVVR